MPVLLSYAIYAPWLDRYQQTFSRILIDSGAYSEFNSGVKVDGHAYRDWYQRWVPHADAIAGLDDISGNWKRSLKNYEQFGGFPTMHDTDPPELLPDLIALAREQGQVSPTSRPWLGFGLKPPRNGKEQWVRWAVEQVPDDVHAHLWAGRAYWFVRRIDTVDSTNWWRDAMALRLQLPWLTYGECLEIVVKRYQRETRQIRETVTIPSLFDGM